MLCVQFRVPSTGMTADHDHLSILVGINNVDVSRVAVGALHVARRMSSTTMSAAYALTIEEVAPSHAPSPFLYSTLPAGQCQL